MLENEDEFWDIDRIMPPDRSTRHTADTSSVEISFGDGDATSGAPIPERHLKAKSIIDTYEKKTSRLISSYKPSCPLITSVNVYAWPVKYTFYEKFISDGEKYYRATVPDDCGYTPFFSYMPQYNQLNLKQLRYYIKWRSSFKSGSPLKVDFSYVLLYIYELLNLERISTPEKRLNALCDVWLYYREQFPQTDKYLAEWVCDFCLIHTLPPPSERLSSILPDICRIAQLREFYTDKSFPSTIESYITSNSTYNYCRSNVVNERNEGVFKKHVIRASAYALERARALVEGESTPVLVRISRDCYSGALCTADVKRRIDVDVYRTQQPIKHKGEITALVRYCENGVRAHLGIKSRISATGLSDELAKYADEYFNAYLPPLRTPTQQRRSDEERRYAAYESDTSDFTTDDALKIEESSWQITKELLPDEYAAEEEAPPVLSPVRSVEDTEGSPYDALLKELTPLQLQVLRLLSNGDTLSAASLCTRCGAFLDAVTDEINNTSADVTDDIIIEDNEIINDYADDLREALERSRADG